MYFLLCPPGMYDCIKRKPIYFSKRGIVPHQVLICVPSMLVSCTLKATVVSDLRPKIKSPQGKKFLALRAS